MCVPGVCVFNYTTFKEHGAQQCVCVCVGIVAGVGIGGEQLRANAGEMQHTRLAL